MTLFEQKKPKKQKKNIVEILSMSIANDHIHVIFITCITKLDWELLFSEFRVAV